MSPSLARSHLANLSFMEGSAKIISLIARDENQHLVITQNILNKWREGDDPEMKRIWKEEEQWVIKTFQNAVNQEKLWAEYLFKNGSMIGLNEKLLYQYVEWIANRRIKAYRSQTYIRYPCKKQPTAMDAALDLFQRVAGSTTRDRG